MPLIPHHFFEYDIPAFIRAIERIAKAMEAKTGTTNVVGFIEKLADHLAIIEGQLDTLLGKAAYDERRRIAEGLEADARCWPDDSEVKTALLDQAARLRTINADIDDKNGVKA